MLLSFIFFLLSTFFIIKFPIYFSPISQTLWKQSLKSHLSMLKIICWCYQVWFFLLLLFSFVCCSCIVVRFSFGYISVKWWNLLGKSVHGPDSVDLWPKVVAFVSFLTDKSSLRQNLLFCFDNLGWCILGTMYHSQIPLLLPW